MRLPRLPLTRIASPGAMARATIGASAAESAAWAPRLCVRQRVEQVAHQRAAGEHQVGRRRRRPVPGRRVPPGRRRRVPACRRAPRCGAAPVAGPARPARRASRRRCRCSSRRAAGRCRAGTAMGRRAPRPDDRGENLPWRRSPARRYVGAASLLHVPVDHAALAGSGPRGGSGFAPPPAPRARSSPCAGRAR